MKHFDLTFSQCKAIANAGMDLRQAVERLNDQPEWLTEMGAIDSAYELAAIIQGGCASGAYMSAVTYYTANKIMAEYGDDVLEYLDNEGGFELSIDVIKESWSGLAVKLLSIAVECWCYNLSDISEILGWEE